MLQITILLKNPESSMGAATVQLKYLQHLVNKGPRFLENVILEMHSPSCLHYEKGYHYL